MNILKSSFSNGMEESEKVLDPSRRRFFQLAGGAAGAGLLFSACHPVTKPTDIYLGSGDIALLNFLYVLEQLEADFYTRAVTGAYLGISSNEYLALVDVRDQEIGHREYIKSLLGPTNVSSPVITNFSGVNFANRSSVLQNASVLEDLVIAGFNGAAGLFSNTAYPLSFLKLVSVEGRHSAYFRDALSHNNFTDTTVVDIDGLNQSLPPSAVLASAQQFLTSRFDSSKLP